MPTARNQHYVPQRYLRRFTHDGNSIFAFDKKTKQSFHTNVRNVASEKGFFDVSFESIDGNTQMAEDEITQYENHADGAMRQFLGAIENKNRFDPHCPGLKESMGHIIAFQFLRTRQFRESVERAVTDLVRVSNRERENVLFAVVVALLTTGTLIAEKREGQLDSALINALPNTASIEHAKALFSGGYRFTTYAAEILKDHILLVGDNQTDQPFYTSDAPVSLFPPDDKHGSSGLGFNSKGIQVIFPISSRYIVVLKERSYFADEQIHEGRIRKVTPQGVYFYNGLQVCTSYRQVYCSHDAFDTATEILNQSPILSEIDRPRSNVAGFEI